MSVAPALPAGSAVTLWVDRAGRVVADPAEQSAEAWAFGISAGLTVVALSWALLTLRWSAVWRVTASCSAAGWAPRVGAGRAAVAALGLLTPPVS